VILGLHICIICLGRCCSYLFVSCRIFCWVVPCLRRQL